MPFSSARDRDEHRQHNEQRTTRLTSRGGLREEQGITTVCNTRSVLATMLHDANDFDPATEYRHFVKTTR